MQLLITACASRSAFFYDALNAVLERRDLYGELGLDPDSDTTLLKRAYRDMALKLHPDKVKDPSKKAEAGRKYARLTEAYRILTDDEARAEYLELRNSGAQRASYADRYYHRHTHKYGIPPHNPFKVFLALVLILSAMKYGGQHLTYQYYLRAALSNPRYKAWAKAQGDTGGERLKLVGVKPPSWDSIFAVQILMLPYHVFRLLRWLYVRFILRKPFDQVEYLAQRFDLSEEEVAQVRARFEAQKKQAEESGGAAHVHKRRR